MNEEECNWCFDSEGCSCTPCGDCGALPADCWCWCDDWYEEEDDD